MSFTNRLSLSAKFLQNRSCDADDSTASQPGSVLDDADYFDPFDEMSASNNPSEEETTDCDYDTDEEDDTPIIDDTDQSVISAMSNEAQSGITTVNQDNLIDIQKENNNRYDDIHINSYDSGMHVSQEISMTSIDNLKCDSGVHSNLDVSEVPHAIPSETREKFCSQVHNQLASKQRIATPRPKRKSWGLKPKPMPTKYKTGHESRESPKRHQNGEIELERPLKKFDKKTEGKENLVILKKEIQTKNQEIKELKLKLKNQKEQIKDLTNQLEKTTSAQNCHQIASKGQIRQLKDDLRNLKKERESLKQELTRKNIEDRQRHASSRRNSLLEQNRKKTERNEQRRSDVQSAKESLQLEDKLKKKEKELEKQQKAIYKLECEKLYLGEEIYRLTGIEESFWADEEINRPNLTPKEKSLVRKNSSLVSEVSRLQVTCKNLSQENSSLKNKMDVKISRPVERFATEKTRLKEMQKLKQKNSELAIVTRQLEDKIKALEEKAKGTPIIGRPVSQLIRQKEKEASYQRELDLRDEEIKKMKVRMKELVNKLTGKNGEITRAQSTLELDQIIRTVTKEKLQLEKQFAHASKGLSRGSDQEVERNLQLATFHDTNTTLRQQLDDLELLTRQHHTLQKHVQEKDLECVTLKEKLKLKNELCQDLESQLAKVIEKNTELTIQNSDLQKQIQDLQHVTVSEECRSLKNSLGSGPISDWPTGEDTCVQNCPANLESCMRLDNAYGMAEGQRGRGDASVEQVLTQMKEAENKRKELEKQHSDALVQLRQKQHALEGALGSQIKKKECAEAIEALKSKIRELEKKAKVQNLRHEELLLEMQTIKRGQISPKNSWSRSGSLSAELQSPESGEITPGLNTLTTTSSSFISPTSHGFSSNNPTYVGSTASEIDKIMAKIRQDNRILAALDKSRSNIAGLTGHDGPAVSSTLANFSFGSAIATLSPGFTSTSNMSHIYSTPLNTSTATTMAALDLSQPFQSSLVNSFTNPVAGLLDPNLSALSLGLNLGTSSFGAMSTSLPSSSIFTNSFTGTSPNGFAAGLSNYGINLAGLNLFGPGLSSNTRPGETSSLPTIITTSYDKDDKNILNGNIPGVVIPPNLLQTDNRVLDVLEIPGKGRCHVYIARYSYDPLRQSPNDNPEAELTLNAGDYVLVWGSMDEVSPRTIDGFFDGEVLDGRRGLVPSNFVEKLVGDDLIEFHQSIVMGLRECDESVSTSVPHDLDFISQEESHLLMAELGLNQPDSGSYSSYLDLEDIVEEPDDPHGEQDLFFSVLVPPPVQLTLERQLNKSILIGWNPPPDAPPGTIESYHVYVNGLLKTTVKATERTRALVEGVDSAKLHRISVRSVTPNRRTSRDAACTMIIGNDPPLCPSHVRASNISSTSAVISWLPSNSNFQHTVCVNSVEVRTVKPGVYRHTITGLSPNTVYRVTVKAKNLRAPQFNEKLGQAQERLSAVVEFRTLPKGLPDPPVDVQVEMGPQDGSLLVTWLPVTIDSTGGMSNGAPVTGYAVYADGKKITEVDSPTGDHALIDLNQIHGFEPKQITVRTKSRESVSADSVPTPIPSHFHKGRSRIKLPERDLCPSDFERPSELSDIEEESETEYSEKDLTSVVENVQGTRLPVGQQQQGAARGLKDKLFGRRTPAPTPGVRTDHLGQTILEHEDNLSDKEIYPNHASTNMPPHPSATHTPHHQLPHPNVQQPPGRGAGPAPRNRPIPKDHAGMDPHMDEYHDDEYDSRRSRYDMRNQPSQQRGTMDRGRPTPMQRTMPRDYRDQHASQWDQRDPRDQYQRERRDQRDMRDTRDYREPVDRYDDRRHRDYDRSRGENPRIFVALFDYDPPTMSPNPEACEEELGFREGQLIKVFGDKDPDGFYWGEAGGRSGYVPCNMVSEVQVDDDRVAQELLKESDTGRRRRDQSFSRRAHAGDRWGDIYANMPVRKMVALYDYDPQELSPNVDSEVELSFQTGDMIFVYGDMDDDGFYMGELRGQRGLVPSNFLQDVPSDYDEHRSRRDTLDPRDRPQPTHRNPGPGPGAHGPPPPQRPDQRDRRKGNENGPNGQPSRGSVRSRVQLRPGEKW